MASPVVVLDSSKEKAKHAFALRWRSFSKATGLIGTILAISSASLMFADRVVDRHQ